MHAYLINNVSVVMHFSHITYKYCSNSYIYIDQSAKQYRCYIMEAAGLCSGNTLAYHTGDPGSIPGRGDSYEKCESIRGKFLSAIPMPDTGVYKRDWWRLSNYLCLHYFL